MIEQIESMDDDRNDDYSLKQVSCACYCDCTCTCEIAPVNAWTSSRMPISINAQSTRVGVAF